ncbi:transglutaminase domain-containing protein [Paenibacillus illinoisensis]|uniref:transglutaminase domain-containing protein n=1 Tax=Paenibacillus illinoisensis TaxID=59845 RepID=UPI0020408D6C|nr:transglutaminase domain-containing protein [Paenibacillus illinoisensis]MCM3207567.1 transglutaminase [Paenibacillus illinoisensis]
MGKNGKRVITILLAGCLIAVALPRAVDLDQLYAASDTSDISTTKDLRQTLLTAMSQRTEELVFTYKGDVKGLKKQLQSSIDEAMTSDPYIQYTVKSYAFNYKGSNVSAEVHVNLSYRETKEQTDYVNRKVTHVLKEIITPGMTNHEKVKAIHDWIVLHLAYDTSLQKYTAYDGLVTGSTVCQGYSLLAYRMLEQVGIENRIVEGTAGDQLHAWNIVKLDGKWYHMDTTWDDPTPDRKGKVSHNYYLLSDDEMARDHIWTGKGKYPTASAPYREALQTLIQSGGSKAPAYQKLYHTLEYSLYDEKDAVSGHSALETKVQNVLKEGGTTLTFRYKGTETSLVEDLQNLYQLGMKSISYYVSKMEDTTDLRVKINWTL